MAATASPPSAVRRRDSSAPWATARASSAARAASVALGDGPGDVLDGAVLLVGRAHAGGGLGDEPLDAGEYEGGGLRGAAGELAVTGQRRLAIAHGRVEAGDDAVELVVARVECGVLGFQDVGVELGLAPAHQQGDDLDDHEEGVDGDAAEGVGQGVRTGPKTWSGAITPTTAWWKTTKPTDSANGSQSR